MPYVDPLKQKAYGRSHYLANKTEYLASNKRRRQQLKEYVRKIKETSPCTDCHKRYPYYVMDFDHLEDKEGLIKFFVNNNNRTGLEKELQKCEIVCSNCHRKRSYNRLMERV